MSATHHRIPTRRGLPAVRNPLRRRAAGLIALFVIAGAMTPLPTVDAGAQQAGSITVALEHDNEREQQAQRQLERLLETFDVEHWIFTPDIRIAAMEVPHSHPVLTVNTKYLDDDHRQMSTFLHEQFHWWVIEEGRDRNLQTAIDEFAAMYPETPARADGGASDTRSTYLHLVVCDLELQAMAVLIGEEAARGLIATQDHYQWIYDKVLSDPAVREVNARNGLIVPDA